MTAYNSYTSLRGYQKDLLELTIDSSKKYHSKYNQLIFSRHITVNLMLQSHQKRYGRSFKAGESQIILIGDTIIDSIFKSSANYWIQKLEGNFTKSGNVIDTHWHILAGHGAIGSTSESKERIKHWLKAQTKQRNSIIKDFDPNLFHINVDPIEDQEGLEKAMSYVLKIEELGELEKINGGNDSRKKDYELKGYNGELGFQWRGSHHYNQFLTMCEQGKFQNN